MEDKNFEDEDLKDIQDTDKAVQGSQDKDKAAHGSSDNADNYEKICYMCRRPESKAGPMITMPGGMCLCHDCMQKACLLYTSPFLPDEEMDENMIIPRIKG